MSSLTTIATAWEAATLRCTKARVMEAYRIGVFTLALVAVFASAAVEGPVPAAESIGHFQVDEGLRVDLVASEPLVASPCAMTWDSQGRLFVVENRGYPVGAADGQAMGVIIRLDDDDGDGRMDRRVVFADGLTFPNGITPWRRGFFVTCAPDILYLEDSDGDGRADVREVVLSGFDIGRSTQLRVAFPLFGPDGWIYITTGLAGPGKISSPRYPNRPAVEIATDSRFNPFTFEIEALDGRGQFGQTFDDWGARFHCMNRVHIQHAVISSAHLRRNPQLAFSRTVNNVPESMVDDLLKSKNLAARIYPVSDNITTADSHAGTFSAACGVHVYRGAGLPREYYGDVFVCDPTGNLVHRDRLIPLGPTFSSRMVNPGREFFASRDNWSRPVFLATGPDGALYVCDMYRKTIEHPDYLPREVRKRTNFDGGREMGRIWKITAEDEPADPKAPITFSDAAPEMLVEQLGHPNVWQRDTAMRLLIEGQETRVVPLLLSRLPGLSTEGGDALLSTRRQADLEPRSLDAVERVNMLNTLLCLGWNPDIGARQESSVDRVTQSRITATLIRCAVDEAPGVRLVAWRWLGRASHPPLRTVEAAMWWAKDPHPGVRFQVALALGHWRHVGALPALARIALTDGRDQWTRAATLSGLRDDEDEFIKHLLAVDGERPAPELMAELGRMLGRRLRSASSNEPTSNPIQAAANWPRRDEDWRLAFWGGTIEALLRGEGGRSKNDLLTFLGFGRQEQEQLHLRASRILSDRERALELRVAAASVLFALASPSAINELKGLLRSGHPARLQAAAIGLLARRSDDSTINSLLEPDLWASLSPSNRALLTGGLLSRTLPTAGLLKAFEEKRLPINLLSVAQRGQLQRHRDPTIRERAVKLFRTVETDRMRVYDSYKTVAQLPGAADPGRALFALHCASCHRLDRVGFALGPDLFGIRNQSKEAILLHILVPNHEVIVGFNGYDLEAKDGGLYTGLISSETENSITLRQAQGIEASFSRSDIRSLRAASISLMPDGYEQNMSRQEMAHLLAYLKGE